MATIPTLTPEKQRQQIQTQNTSMPRSSPMANASTSGVLRVSDSSKAFDAIATRVSGSISDGSSSATGVAVHINHNDSALGASAPGTPPASAAVVMVDSAGNTINLDKFDDTASTDSDERSSCASDATLELEEAIVFSDEEADDDDDDDQEQREYAAALSKHLQQNESDRVLSAAAVAATARLSDKKIRKSNYNLAVDVHPGTGSDGSASSSVSAGVVIPPVFSPKDHTGKHVIEGIEGAFYSDDIEAVKHLEARRHSLSNGDLSADIAAASAASGSDRTPSPANSDTSKPELGVFGNQPITNSSGIGKDSDIYARQMVAANAARAAAETGAPPPNNFSDRGSSRFISGMNNGSVEAADKSNGSTVDTSTAAVDNHRPLPPSFSPSPFVSTGSRRGAVQTAPHEFVGTPQPLEPRPLIPKAHRDHLEFLLRRLKVHKRASLTSTDYFAVACKTVLMVCDYAKQQLLSEPPLLEISAPVNIVGDIHGQFADLIKFFELGGWPPEQRYLFLGDYVDRGNMGIECTLLLLCLKLLYPDSIYMLRGNHECASISRIYGFYEETRKRFNSVKQWTKFIEVFDVLPLAAVVDNCIFATHGGLSPDLHSLDQIRCVRRPMVVPEGGLVCDLLWADPDMEQDVADWRLSDRGVSYFFSGNVVREFLLKNGFELFVRAHQVVENGYEFFPPDQRWLVTIFSAANYCGQFDNAAAMMLVDADLSCSFRVLCPFEHQERFANHLRTTSRSR